MSPLTKELARLKEVYTVSLYRKDEVVVKLISALEVAVLMGLK